MLSGVNCSYYIRKNSDSWIEPILIQWIRLHREYIEIHSFKDSLFWHNERTNIGAFAGAVWRCGGLVAEEFAAGKGKDEDESDGRIDLYFTFADRSVVCEAKQNWVSLKNNNALYFRETIDKYNRLAMDATRRTQEFQKEEYALGLSFLPTFSIAGDKSDQAMDYFQTSVDETKCDFYAWFENTSGKDLIWDDEICNAVALIGTFIGKS